MTLELRCKRVCRGNLIHTTDARAADGPRELATAGCVPQTTCALLGTPPNHFPARALVPTACGRELRRSAARTRYTVLP